jgi:hypothetical protein
MRQAWAYYSASFLLRRLRQLRFTAPMNDSAGEYLDHPVNRDDHVVVLDDDLPVSL